MYLPFIIDFETTDKDPSEAHAVEIAVLDYQSNKGFTNFIKPPVPIPPETSAIHHIIDDDVQDAKDMDANVQELEAFIEDQTENEVILVAHNAKYEQTVLSKAGFNLDIKWVCTYKCAMFLFPDAPSFSNEGLRYWLGLGPRGRANMHATHTAMYDCEVTALLLSRFMEDTTIDQMIEWTLEPAQPPKMPFGKHRGMPWNQVPVDYLQWMTRQLDMDEDIKYVARKELHRRGYIKGAPRAPR